MNDDIATLAREVVRQHGHLDRDALSLREKERLDLARAVLRAADLADELDREGNARMEDADPTRARAAYAHAARIRNALNGSNT